MVRRPLEDKRFFDTLHHWLKRHLPKPELCEMCNEVPPRDLSNKTGLYNRDFKNWWYICKRCHWYFDIETMTIPSSKGLKRSQETIEKQRKSIMGKNKGKKRTEETKKILSEAHRGTRLSEYHRKRISEAIKEHWKTRNSSTKSLVT